jgi:hypothetical protein
LTSFVGALTSSLGLGISKKDHGPSAPNQLEARMKTKSAPTNGTNSTKIAPEIVTSVRYSAKVSTGHKASPTVTTDHTNQLIPTVSRWHERTLDSQCTPTPSACRSTICGSSRVYDFSKRTKFYDCRIHVRFRPKFISRTVSTPLTFRRIFGTSDSAQDTSSDEHRRQPATDTRFGRGCRFRMGSGCVCRLRLSCLCLSLLVSWAESDVNPAIVELRRNRK